MRNRRLAPTIIAAALALGACVPTQGGGESVAPEASVEESEAAAPAAESMAPESEAPESMEPARETPPPSYDYDY